MNRRILLSLVILSGSWTAFSQALRDINYQYLYNPESAIEFTMKPVRGSNHWTILYKLSIKDTSSVRSYEIQWQNREALNSKEGSVLSGSQTRDHQDNKSEVGRVIIPLSAAPKIVVAKVINRAQNTAWLFYAPLESNYPVDLFIESENIPLLKTFINTEKTFSLSDSSDVFVSFYNDRFPTAAPGFSETQGKVSKAIDADSVWRLPWGASVSFSANGLYLFQKDTSIANGLAVRNERDYPRYTLIQNLPGPFVYICTKLEYDRLEAAKGDKKAFDRTVLTITGDTERAKQLIRNYFRRVELANQYFTSYKEGWKTDRGMVYIIFGPPDEVYRFYDREVWDYDNTLYKVSFDFVKSSSVFDPDNYVLIRNQKYKEVWYQVVDLWRNARF
jgi:GWxTD domain-containing protein